MAPFAVENETELETGVTSLSHPSVDKDANIFSRDGENSFGKSGGRYKHSAPLVGLALLLRRLHGKRELLIEYLDEQRLTDSKLEHSQHKVGFFAHNLGVTRSGSMSRMWEEMK